MIRWLKGMAPFLTTLVLAIAVAHAAAALGTPQVRKVVAVMEALAEDGIDLAYDEEAAETWYEEDDAYRGRIAKAGFNRESWRENADRTIKGFYASLDAAEIDAIFTAMGAFRDRPDFSDDQKAAMEEFIQS